ncbi:hypothetical protein B0A48_08657 [Cryoendolithus antarcticus]|uniref:Uncharacterized protein n=1 Tax=Cryoendolithus antarcticus TaxID=1507870 RepID=A0A1V8T419_9PEZI|nr:hypothetical protein B0A48_08657 [Cryoendolithus antarcticus]
MCIFTQTVITTLVIVTIDSFVPTATETNTFTLFDTVTTITPPPCILPSQVAPCQSSWETWASYQVSLGGFTFIWPEGCDTVDEITVEPCLGLISSYDSVIGVYESKVWSPTPMCTQASITGNFCDGLISSYVDAQSSYEGEGDGVVGGQTVWTSANGSEYMSYSWPSTSPLAPGCSLGCVTQSCQLQAGTVRLLYWPPGSTTQASDDAYITAPVNGTGPVTASAFGYVFTSPTVYISFDSLYARDSCSAIGPTYINEVVALTDPAELSSLYPSVWDNYDNDATKHNNALLQTAPFNYTDLYVTPTPESIYMSQPRCAYASWDTLGPQKDRHVSSDLYATWQCPRIAPYEPILAIPDQASCIGGVNGAYEPPIPLTPASAVVGVCKSCKPETSVEIALKTVTTVTGVCMTCPRLHTSTPAAPASTPDSPAAPPTTIAGPTTAIAGDPPDPSIKSTASQSTAQKGQGSSQPAVSQPVNSQPAVGDPGSSDRETIRPVSDDPGSGNSGTTQLGSNPQASNQPSVSNSPQPTQSLAIINAPTTKALSILESALSSAQQAASSRLAGTTPIVGIGSTGNSDSAQGSAVVIAVPTGGSAILSQVSGGGVAVDIGRSATTIANGGIATVGGQTFSVRQSGGAVVVGSSTQILPAAPDRTSVAIVAGGQTLTVLGSGSAVVVAQGGSTVTVVPGQPATLGSQTISLASDNGGLVVGSATFANVGTSSPANAGSGLASAVLTAGGQTITAVAQGGSVVFNNGGTEVTVAIGATATTAGQVVNVPRTGGVVVIDGSALQLSASQAAPSQGVFTAGGQTITAVAQGDVLVLESNGQATTIPANGVATIGGQVVSNPGTGGAVIVGGSTLSLSATPTKGFTAGRRIITAIHEGSAVVLQAEGQSITLAAGDIGTVAGQAVIVDDSGDVVVDGTTVHLGPATASAGTAIFTQDGHTITAIRQGNLVILQEGGRATTVAADATVAFVGETIANPGAHITAATGLTTLVQDGQTLTALDAGGSMILVQDGTTITLAKGQKTVFHGETISAPSNGAAIVVNGTQTLSLTSLPTGMAFATLVHAGQTLSAFDAGAIIVLVENWTTVTLAKGQQTVLDGETISALATGGAIVVDGTDTLPLTGASATATSMGSGVEAGPEGAAADPTGSGAWKFGADWYGLLASLFAGVFVL